MLRLLLSAHHAQGVLRPIFADDVAAQICKHRLVQLS